MAVSDNEIRMILRAQDDTAQALKQVAANLDDVRDHFEKAAEAADNFRQSQAKAKEGGDWLKVVNRITNETASTMYSLQGAANNATSAIAALGQIGTQGIRAVFNAMISAIQTAQNFVTAFQQINAIVGAVLNTIAPGLGTLTTLIGNFAAIMAQGFLLTQQIVLAVWREIFTAGVNALTGLAQIAISAAGAIGQGLVAGIGVLYGVLSQAGKTVGGFVANILGIGPAFEAATQPGTAFGNMLKDNIIAGAAFAVGMAAAQKALEGISSVFGFIGQSFIEFNALMQRSTIAFTASFSVPGEAADIAAGKARGFLSALQELAATTPADFGNLIKAAQGFIGMGISAEKTLPILKDMVAVMALAGRSGADLQGIAKGLQDIAAKGRVSAQDMRQLAEHGIPAWQYLAKAAMEAGTHGVTSTDSLTQAIGKLRKASEAGAVSADELFAAFNKAAQDPRVQKALKDLESSWDVVTSNIADRGNMLVHAMTEPVFNALGRLLKYFSDFLADPAVMGFAQQIGATFEALLGMLEPAVQGIGDAFKRIGAAFTTGGFSGAFDQIQTEFGNFAKNMFGAGWEAISEFAKGLYQGASQLLSSAAEGAAQIVANFLVGHSPPPEGPLKTIDEAGKQAVETYLHGMLQAPIEDILGQVAVRIKKGLTGASPGENQRGPSFSTYDDATTKIAAIERLQKPTQDDANTLKNIYDDIGGVVSGLADKIADVRQAQDDVNFVIKDIKANYEGQIEPLERQLHAIQEQNKAYYEMLTIQDRLAQIQIDRERIALSGDPAKRAQIEGQLELLNAQAKELSLQEKVVNIEEQRKNFAKEMANWRRSMAEYDRTEFNNNLRGRITRTQAPEKPDEKKFDLAQKRLGIELQIAKLEQQQSNLGDKAGLARLKVRESILKNQADLNRLSAEENDLLNRQAAIPIEQHIKNLKDDMQEVLKPFEDYARSLGRSLDILQQQENAWKRLQKNVKDVMEAVNLIVTGAGMKEEGIQSKGQQIAQSLLNGFRDWWTQNAPAIIGGLIGSQLGGMLFGPLGAIAGGLFGAQFGKSLNEILPNWDQLLMGKIGDGLAWLQTSLTDLGKSFGNWGEGATAGSAAVGDALKGLGGIFGAIKLALTGDIPGAIKLAMQAFSDLGNAVALAVVEVGSWLNLNLSPSENIFSNLGQIVSTAYTMISDAITGTIRTVAGWLNIPLDSSTSNWSALGLIVKTVIDDIGYAINTAITWIDNFVGRDPSSTADSNWSKLVDIWNGIVDSISSGINTVWGWFDSLIKFDPTSGMSRWDTLIARIQELGTWAKDTFTQFVNLIAEITGAPIGTDNWSTIENILGRIWEMGKNVVSFVIDFAKTVAQPETMGLVLQTFRNLRDIGTEILQLFSGTTRSSKELGDSLGGIRTPGQEAADTLISILGGLKNFTATIASVIDVFNLFKDDLVELAKFIGNVAMVLSNLGSMKPQAIWASVGDAVKNMETMSKNYDAYHKRVEDRFRDGAKTIADETAKGYDAAAKAAADGSAAASAAAEQAQAQNPPPIPAPDPGDTTKAWDKAGDAAAKAAADAGKQATEAAAKAQGGPSTGQTAVAVPTLSGDPEAVVAAAKMIMAANDAVAQSYVSLSGVVTGSMLQIVNTTGDGAASLVSALNSLVAAFTGGMTAMAGVDTTGIDGAISRVAYAAFQHQQEFLDTGVILGTALVTGIAQGIDDNADQLVISGAVARLLKALWDLANDKFCATGAEDGHQWVQCLADQIDKDADPLVISGATARLLSALWDLADSGFGPTGTHEGVAFMSALTAAIDNHQEDVVGAVQRALYAISQLQPDFDKTGTSLGDAFSLALVKSIDDQLENIVGAIQRMLYQLYQLQTSFQATGQSLGDAFMAGLLTSLSDGVTSANTAGSLIGQALLAGLLSQVPGAQQAGQNTADGYGRGITAAQAEAAARTAGLGEEAIKALNEALKNHSPSKEAEESGRNVALGFAAGINADAEVAKNIGIIVREALNANVDPAIALALAKVESGFNAKAVGDQGHSVGLFQLNDRGAGAGLTKEQRMDPATNARTFFEQEGKHFQAAIRDGFRGMDLAKEFGRRAERPLEGTEGKYADSYSDILKILMARAGGGGGPVTTLSPNGQWAPPPVDVRPPQLTPNVQGQGLARNFKFVDQLSLAGLSSDEAMAACGPAAAMAFAQAVGRNPTAQEAMAIAKQIGWTAGAGMGGSANFMELANRLGAQTQKLPATQENIDAALKGGNPFAVSTPDHYFQVAGGQQGAGGKLNVGSSGTVYRKGSSQMTLDEMQALAGEADSIIVLTGKMGDAATTAANVASDAVAGSAQSQVTSIQSIQQQLQNLLARYTQTGKGVNDLNSAVRSDTGVIIGATDSILAGLLGTSKAADTLGSSTNTLSGGMRICAGVITGETVPATTSLTGGLQTAGQAATAASMPFTNFIKAVADLKPQIEAGAIAGQGLQEQIIALASSTKLAEQPLKNLQAGTESSEAAMADIIATSKGLSSDFLDLWKNLQTGKVNIQDATNQFFNLIAAFKQTPAAADAAAKAIEEATARAAAAPKPGEVRQHVTAAATPPGTRTPVIPAPRPPTPPDTRNIDHPPGTGLGATTPGLNPNQSVPWGPATRPPIDMTPVPYSNVPLTPPSPDDRAWAGVLLLYDAKMATLKDHIQKRTAEVQDAIKQTGANIALPPGADILTANLDVLIPKDLPPEVRDRLRKAIDDLKAEWQKYQQEAANAPKKTPSIVDPMGPPGGAREVIRDPKMPPGMIVDPMGRGTNTPVALPGQIIRNQSSPSTQATQVPTPDPRQAQQAGQVATQAVAAGIQSGLPQIQAALAMISDSLTQLTTTLLQTSAQMADGIRVGTDAIVASLQGAQQAAGAAATEIGNQIVQGFYNAIQSIYNAVPVAQNAVATLLQAMATEAQVSSPSKKSEKIGQEIGKGLGLGLKEQRPELEAIAKQVTGQFLGAAMSSAQIGEVQWGFEKQILELNIRKAQEEAKLVPIKKEEAQLTRDIASLEKGSLADRMRLVQIDGRRMQIELAQLQAQKQLRQEFGAEQERIGKRELEISAALAQADLARVPLQTQIKNLQEDIEATQRGSLEDQLKSFDLQTQQMQLNLQQAEAQQSINQQFKDILGYEQRLAQLATQRAKADLQILPTRQALAAVDREIEDIQRGTLADQITDIRRDETRTKNKIRQLQIEKELGKLKKSSALEGDTLFEANQRRFGVQDYTTSTSGEKIGSLEKELSSIQQQNDELDQQETMQKALRDLAVINDRISKATLEDQIRQHDALYQKMYDETELLTAQKAVRDAEKAEMEAMILGPLKQRADLLNGEIEIMKARNELASRADERELLALQDQLRQMDLANRGLIDEKTLLDAQKAALEANIALREYQLTGPLKHELELLDEEAKIIELQNKLRAQPQRERLTQLEYEEEIQSKTLNEINDQLEALQKQKAVYEAIVALISAIAENTLLPEEKPNTPTPGGGGSGGGTVPALPGGGPKVDVGDIKGAQDAVHNFQIALEQLVNGNYVLTLDDKDYGLTQNDLNALRRQLEGLDKSQPAVVHINGRDISLTAEQIHNLDTAIGQLPQGIDLRVDDQTLVRVATQDIPNLQAQLDAIKENGGVVNINGQNIQLTKDQVQSLIDQLNGVKDHPADVAIVAPDVTPIDTLIAGLQTELDGLNAQVASPDISAEGMAAAQQRIAEIQAQLDALNAVKADPSVDLADPTAVPRRIEELQAQLAILDQTISTPGVSQEDIAAAQAQAIILQNELLGLQTLVVKPTVDPGSIAAATTAADGAKASVDAIDDNPVTPIVDPTAIVDLGDQVENIPDPVFVPSVDEQPIDALAFKVASIPSPALVPTVDPTQVNTLQTQVETMPDPEVVAQVDHGQVDAVKTSIADMPDPNVVTQVDHTQVDSVASTITNMPDSNVAVVVDDSQVTEATNQVQQMPDTNVAVQVDRSQVDTTQREIQQMPDINVDANVDESDLNNFMRQLRSITSIKIPLTGKAAGGPVEPRMYIVGERGPELFVPWTHGQIIPNGRTMDLLGAAGYEGRADGGMVYAGGGGPNWQAIEHGQTVTGGGGILERFPTVIDDTDPRRGTAPVPTRPSLPTTPPVSTTPPVNATELQRLADMLRMIAALVDSVSAMIIRVNVDLTPLEQMRAALMYTQQIIQNLVTTGASALDQQAQIYAQSQSTAGMVYGGPNSVVMNNPTGRTATAQEIRNTNLTVNYNYYGQRQISGQSELETVVRDAVRYSEQMG
jgi:tape measure domain-containing protein